MKRSNFLFLFFIVLLSAILRFYQLDKVPYGLYIDEVSIGYNAYQILQTGKDEYGVSYPLFFRSFGDYKQPVYIYMTSAAMAVFGKTEFAVRFPSALFGTLTILVLFFFSRTLLTKKDNANLLALIASFLLAISPWHIHFSRGGFEVNVALFFYLLGLYFLLLCWQKKQLRFLIFSIATFAVTLYTYHTYKILTPLTWLIAGGILFYHLKKFRKKIMIVSLIFFLVCLPLVQFSFSKEGAARAISTSAFAELDIKNPLQKVFLYPAVYLKNYLTFYSPVFLFGFGDHHGRHQVVGMGLFYKWQLPFLLLGIFWLLQHKNKTLRFMLIALLIGAPLVPAVAVPSPHTLRSLLLVVPLTILIAGGIAFALSKLSSFLKWSMVVLLVIFVFVNSSLYLHKYYEHYLTVNALDWGAGYKETVLKAQHYEKEYAHILVEERLSFAPIYFKFYAPETQVVYMSSDMVIPSEWKKEQVLFIRPFYGNRNEKQCIDQVYLPGPNKDIYTQFWKL